MSKMSQLHAELSEQAIELGFESLDEALANGYEVDYEEGELVNPYVLADKAHEEAHEAWLKERDEVLNELKSILNTAHNQPLTDYELSCAINYKIKAIEHAVKFIERDMV